MLDALNVVVSTIEHSNVTGDVGGFAVKATWKNTASDASANDILGDAGGLSERFLVGIFRIQMQITSHISLARLQPVVMWETCSQEMWQMSLDDTGILDGLVNVSEYIGIFSGGFCTDDQKQLYDLYSLWWCSSCRCGFHNTGTTRYGRRLCRT